MYLEISGRQTGKTTRMLATVKLTILAERIPVIFTFTHKEVLRLMRIFGQDLRGAVYAFSSMKAYNDWTIGRDVSKVDYFYDEFDFIDHDLFVNKNGYYVTTPKRMRTIEDIDKWNRDEVQDPLLTLLKMNNWYYESHSGVGRLLAQAGKTTSIARPLAMLPTKQAQAEMVGTPFDFQPPKQNWTDRNFTEFRSIENWDL